MKPLFFYHYTDNISRTQLIAPDIILTISRSTCGITGEVAVGCRKSSFSTCKTDQFLDNTRERMSDISTGGNG
jgi:hypothetical protein